MEVQYDGHWIVCIVYLLTIVADEGSCRLNKCKKGYECDESHVD
jgi:hypothetical protein